ncbi:MAG: sulfate ABC transporter substrate-binding protein [Coleofasciculaceae cyanobacterium SM2_1_6]|nr:sulfate ABC transporter substrate-binding protein [Coleofasciculaceae cyanobacterium SM2_1_6]
MQTLTKLQRLAKRFGQGFRKYTALFVIGVTLTAVVAACGTSTNTASTSADGSKPDVELTLVSFAVTREAYTGIIPKFVEKWKQEQNQNVIFKQSYGASGTQARAVLDGLDADIVHLALEPDTHRIEQGGLIDLGWQQEFPNGGIVSSSVAAIVVRDGNPKNIKTWADLGKADIATVTADPKTSGGARWNILALWGAITKSGGTEEQATQLISQVIKNAPVLPKDAREASDAFLKKQQGDALINYENEVILANLKGEKTDYVIPEVNISIDNPIAIVDKNVAKHNTKEVAEAFVNYLYTPEAQTEFAKVGFRPVEASVASQKEFTDKFPAIKTLFTAKDLGGWDAINQQFFAEGALFDKVVTSVR